MECTNLHTEASVNLGNTLVIFPNNAELNNAFGYLNDLKGFLVSWVGL